MLLLRYLLRPRTTAWPPTRSQRASGFVCLPFTPAPSGSAHRPRFELFFSNRKSLGRSYLDIRLRRVTHLGLPQFKSGIHFP
jgi:hypothetical protein